MGYTSVPVTCPSCWKWMVCGKQVGDTVLVTSSPSSGVLPSAKTITAFRPRGNVEGAGKCPQLSVQLRKIQVSPLLL